MIGFAGYSYYQDTQERIQQLAENNAKLETALQQNEETLREVERTAEKQAQLTGELSEKLQKAESYKDDLISKLQKHDLTKLSAQKPAMIEKRINDATKKIFDDIESDTAK
jgi:chromosome segregation ATPase